MGVRPIMVSMMMIIEDMIKKQGHERGLKEEEGMIGMIMIMRAERAEEIEVVDIVMSMMIEIEVVIMTWIEGLKADLDQDLAMLRIVTGINNSIKRKNFILVSERNNFM